MQHHIRQALSAEQGVAGSQIRPLALLQGRQEHKVPMPSGRTRRRGERHGLVDRCGVRQRIGFDGERTHLFDERADGMCGQHATRFVARCVAEQAHRRVQTVVRRTACRGIFQRYALPDPCLVAGSPRAIKHVLRFTGDELTFRFDGLVEHFPQARKCFGLRVGAQYGGDYVEHAVRIAFQ